MPIPSHVQFARPVLEALAAQPGGLNRPDLYGKMAEWAHLTPEEREQVIESGQQTYLNRIGWACTWLRMGGLAANPSRGRWTVTAAGTTRLRNPAPFTAAELRALRATASAGAEGTAAADDESAAVATPEERIAGAVAEIHVALRAQLLTRLKANSPAFFERAVLKLLSAMGYGRFEQTGRTGDHGIDGVLYLDHLGLERVYVQAKRWESDVNRDRLQAFSGAMDEHHAVKGVIVTTSRFAESARKYVPGASKIIHRLDGDELTRLMVEHGVGVSTYQTINAKRIDEDFFEE